MSIIKLARNAYTKYQQGKLIKITKTDMHNSVNTCPDEIAPLTTAEKREIDAFWKPYDPRPDYDSFRWYYHMTGRRDCYFIPEATFAAHILPYFNNIHQSTTLADKNMYDILFGEEGLPETLVRNINGVMLNKDYQIITEQEATVLASNEEKVVIKPTIASGKGKNVKCINTNSIIDSMRSYQKDYIIQSLIHQHESFSALNSTSVNVVRITSMLFDGKVYLLAPCIRVGDPGKFTDQNDGKSKNVCIGIDDTGYMHNTGIANDGTRLDVLPNGYRFGGKPVQGFFEMQSMAMKLHPRVAKIGLVGWDFTADENGRAVFIETNFKYPGVRRYQECNGPFFGSAELTQKVLGKVFSKSI